MSGPGTEEIVELRVHGVHGTSPASMLGVEGSDVRQVAGDNLTGVYRSKSGDLPYRVLPNAAPGPGGPGRPPVSVEAYSWGALTSGVRGVLGWLQRALWLLLLPFALANLAYWARLRLDDGSSAAAWGGRFTRLGALLLTVFMVLVPSYIGIDLVAWQCYRGGSPGCTPLPGMFDFLADLTPGQRVAAGAVVPLLFVLVLWLLSRQTLSRYEAVSFGDRRVMAHVEGRPLVLQHPSLWQGKQRTQQLQRAHLTVALAVVVGFSGVHVGLEADSGRVLVWVCVAISATLAAVAVGWTMVVRPGDVEYHGPRPQQPSRLPGWLTLAAGATTALHLVALSRTAGLTQQVDFVGHNLWFISVFVALTVVHLCVFMHERMPAWATWLSVAGVVVLAGGALAAHLDKLPAERQLGWVLVALLVLLTTWLSWFHFRFGRSEDGERAAWNGAGASVLLAAAAWVALLFTTAAVTATADWLNGGDHGVDDLVSQLADSDSAAPAAVAGTAGKGRFVATGEVLVRNGVVALDADGPVLLSGTVEVERLYDARSRAAPGAGVVALQKGRVRLDEGRIRLDSAAVRLRDTCVRQEGGGCTAESSNFLVGGHVALSRPVLRIEARGSSVRVIPSDPPVVPLVVPQVLTWAPLVQTLWLVATLVWVAAAYRVFRRSTSKDIADLVVTDRIPPRDRGDSRRARLRAAFAHRAERLVDRIGTITAVLILALIALSSRGEAPWVRYDWARPLATVGMYVALGIGLALVALLSRVRTSADTRRAVGVLWDLTTFWPRAAHPLAPPCYAERVVPELLTRADWVLHYDEQGEDRRKDNLLVLSGHSQGSVIVCAVLSRMSAEDLGRTRVITYGSQIRALYGRVFPAVFGPEQLGYVPTRGPATLVDAFPDVPRPAPEPPSTSASQAEPPTGGPATVELPLMQRVFAARGDWVSLFRRSDPLGFRVFSDHDERPDIYVPEVPDVIVGDAGPRVNTHSGYQHTLEYRTEVARWTGEVVVPYQVSTAHLPALPTG